jgi:hypothetical protein
MSTKGVYDVGTDGVGGRFAGGDEEVKGHGK